MHPSPQIIEGFGHPEDADKSRLYIEGQTVDVCRIGYRRDDQDCLDIGFINQVLNTISR